MEERFAALTDKNAQSSFWVNSRNRLFKHFVQKNISPTGNTKFLEIGCGTGDFIKHIVQNENLDITGSEIYLKGLLYAKKNLPNVNFIQFDITQGVLGDEFDIIVAFDVLEHIEDDVAALSNICEMLNKEGCLILTVPQHMFLWSNLDEIVKHKRRYSRRELVKKLQSSRYLSTLAEWEQYLKEPSYKKPLAKNANGPLATAAPYNVPGDSPK